MTSIIGNPDSEPEKAHDGQLVQDSSLRHLRSEEELYEALATINALIVRGDLDAGEQDYLDVLTDLVERYETDAVVMSPVSDAEILRHLIDSAGITQAKLAADLGIPASTIDEFLSGRRVLDREHVGEIARYFRIKPTSFGC